MKRALLIAIALASCKSQPLRRANKPVEDIDLSWVGPAVWLPGTTLALEGSGFLPALAGASTLTLELGGRRDAVELEASFVDYELMSAVWPGSAASGGAGGFDATATLSTESGYDGRTHQSEPLPLSVTVADALVPVLGSVEDEGRYVNDRVVVRGDGLLLGGAEGQTFAQVQGCFTPEWDWRCTDVGPVELPVAPLDPLDRSAGAFAFAPEIAGIEPGSFEGRVRLVNRHASGEETVSEALELWHEIREPFIAGFTPEAGSLGQIIGVQGGGFVGPSDGDPSATTLVELDGRFSGPTGSGFDVTITLVAEYDEGRLLHYVLNEEDALGRLVDLRGSTGTFTGTARPIVAYRNSTIEGVAVPVSLALEPVKQVAWIKFMPSFVESLRQFGLRNAQDAVKERIVQVVQRDYAGVNLELRLEEPQDFALYSVVEISGPDPNGLGLLGYDNTPGKDVGNLRLYDTIGGVNALTQQDGYPGYGGVFIDSLFAYSHHPPARQADSGLADRVFDDLFDPVRPDRNKGQPVSEAEAADLHRPESNADCPANGRRKQVGCAVFALGNTIGTTLSHEIAHSLGLADPDGEAFHNTGDWKDAIMDGGSSRTFRERAEVSGEGPGVFCRASYDYLREILPTGASDPIPDRQDCY